MLAAGIQPPIFLKVVESTETQPDKRWGRKPASSLHSVAGRVQSRPAL